MQLRGRRSRYGRGNWRVDRLLRLDGGLDLYGPSLCLFCFCAQESWSDRCTNLTILTTMVMMIVGFIYATSDEKYVPSLSPRLIGAVPGLYVVCSARS